MPGWTIHPDSVARPRENAEFGVYSSTYEGIAPDNGPFLGIKGTGGNNTDDIYYEGPLVRLPTITDSTPVSLRFRWSREMLATSGGDQAGEIILGVRQSTGRVDVLSTPGGLDDVAWTQLDSATNNSVLTTPWSGKVVRLYLRVRTGSRAHAQAVDTIQIYQSENALSLPIVSLDDQTLGPCPCEIAAVAQSVQGMGVNTYSGVFTQHDADLSIPTSGPALDMSRQYVSLFANSGYEVSNSTLVSPLSWCDAGASYRPPGPPWWSDAA